MVFTINQKYWLKLTEMAALTSTIQSIQQNPKICEQFATVLNKYNDEIIENFLSSLKSEVPIRKLRKTNKPMRNGLNLFVYRQKTLI